MAKSFASFEASGLKDLLRDIDKVSSNVVKELDLEMDGSSRVIERQAKVNLRNLIDDQNGALLNAISAEKKRELEYEVVAQKFFAPFVEFGTGTMVDVPVGLEDYAMQFYRGPGVNLPARPFLFPAYEEERKKLIDRLKKYLLNNAKRGITVIMPGNSNITGTTTI